MVKEVELLKDCEDVLSRVEMYLDELYDNGTIGYYERYRSPLCQDVSELVSKLQEGDYVHE